MWHMITEGDLKASVEALQADDQTGSADVVDDYTFSDNGNHVHNEIHSDFRFRDGLIVEQRDKCNALKWGVQALGPIKGLASWIAPAKRREGAMAKLKAFIAQHPEYA